MSIHTSGTPEKNETLDRYLANSVSGLQELEHVAATTLEREFLQRWNVAINAKNTYLVLLDYNASATKPYEAMVTGKLSLCEAMYKISRNENTHILLPYFSGGPTLKRVNQLTRIHVPLHDLDTSAYRDPDSTRVTHTYEGIYVAAQPEEYTPNTQVNVSPQSFKDMVYNLDFFDVYKEALDKFWNSIGNKYYACLKGSFIKAAFHQYAEESLTPKGLTLALSAAGVDSQRTWSSLTTDDLETPITKAQHIKQGHIKIENFTSTDLLYFIDDSTQCTLLYIPGNSSPIHEFSTPSKMKFWIADQFSDPDKKRALADHFPLEVRVSHTGFHLAVEGIAKWPNKYVRNIKTSRFGPTLRMYWNPESYLLLAAEEGDIFSTTRDKIKQRSYEDARCTIKTSGDILKDEIMAMIGYINKIAIIFVGIAVGVPEVALGLDALYLVEASVQMSIGMDDIEKGKAIGVKRVGFGMLNAMPVAMSSTSRLVNFAGTELEAGTKLVISDGESPLVNMQRIDIDGEQYQVPTYSTKNGLQPLYDINGTHRVGLWVYKTGGVWKKIGLGGGTPVPSQLVPVTRAEVSEFLSSHGLANPSEEDIKFYDEDDNYSFYRDTGTESIILMESVDGDINYTDLKTDDAWAPGDKYDYSNIDPAGNPISSWRVTSQHNEEYIDVQRIHFDPEHRYTPERLDRVIDGIRKGHYLPAIKVREAGQNFALVDGYHRLKAAKELGLTHVPIIRS